MEEIEKKLYAIANLLDIVQTHSKPFEKMNNTVYKLRCEIEDLREDVAEELNNKKQ
mgnify:CR=1 FL=1|tara:strand:- start:487 stop:654 length:168 start_codon:yes stop_codon:yes gene_type:complete